MTPLPAQALADNWEAELSLALPKLPTVEARFALGNAYVAHRLEVASRGHPECQAFVAQALALLSSGQRAQRYLEAMTAIPALDLAVPLHRYLTGLAGRPGGFVFYYDVYWAAADLCLEAGTDLEAALEAPGRERDCFVETSAEPDLVRVQAEIDWQRALLHERLPPS